MFTNTQAEESATESGSCCTALFPQSNVCRIWNVLFTRRIKTIMRKTEYFSVKPRPSVNEERKRCSLTKVIMQMYLNWICMKD